jgi:hypothetical protein
MRLLIVEPEAEGHHMILYTRLLVREALRRNWEVAILTTEQGRNHPSFGILVADFGSALQTIEMREVSRTASGSISLLASQLRHPGRYHYWRVSCVTGVRSPGPAPRIMASGVSI